MSNQRTKKDKERRRIVYDFATGKLFLAESDVEISPLIPSTGLSEQTSPNGYTIENNVISLCEASTNGPGVVYALQSNKNLAFGKGGLFSILEGKENTAYGYNAGKRLAEGSKNTLVGFSAASDFVEGELNVSVGAQSLCTLTKGDANVSLGVYSGDGLTAGSRNTFLGFHSRTKKQDISCSVVIGYNAVGEKSNELLMSHQIHTFRMRGLNPEPWSNNTTMVCFDRKTGLLAPIRYPSNVKSPKYVEHDTVKKLLGLHVCKDDAGSVFVPLDQAKEVPGITTTDNSGEICGINHPNLIMTLLAAAQDIKGDVSILKKKAKKRGPKTKQRLHELEMKLGKDIELKTELSVLTEKMGNLPTENSESIERLHQKVVKLEKKLVEILAQSSTEQDKFSKLSEKVELLSSFQDEQDKKIHGRMLLLSSQNRELSQKLEENKELFGRLKEESERNSQLVASLQKQNEDILLLLKKQENERRPLSPLKVSSDGGLRKRVLPIDKMLDDWENIS
nr:putative chromosome segregation ATPase [Marseillevirus futianmevirus]